MRGSRWSRVLKFAPFALLVLALFVFVIMQLWNWLMPELFGLKTITYWQALGVFVLSKILFGGFRGGSGGHWRGRKRWEKMSPEEREKFRQGWRERWGGAPPPGESA